MSQKGLKAKANPSYRPWAPQWDPVGRDTGQGKGEAEKGEAQRERGVKRSLCGTKCLQCWNMVGRDRISSSRPSLAVGIHEQPRKHEAMSPERKKIRRRGREGEKVNEEGEGIGRSEEAGKS